ncbi:unnamed protein product [Onchocerca ochengi]|uniref:DUF5641 domain-containing protein n=1 Tax=Onchocerca ochengi TaxID=42157 RepID=A0A182E011_ONCOC|nr:unnamed protein product [Onchocerca ochengi]
MEIGKIKELNESADGKIRSVQTELPNAKILNRPANMLYSLETNQHEISTIPLQDSVDQIEEEEPIARRTRSATRKQQIQHKRENDKREDSTAEEPRTITTQQQTSTRKKQTERSAKELIIDNNDSLRTSGQQTSSKPYLRSGHNTQTHLLCSG